MRLQLHVDLGSIGRQSHGRADVRTNTHVHQVTSPERCADVEIVSGHSISACRPAEGRRCRGQRAARRRAGDDASRLRDLGVCIVIFNDGPAEVRLQLHVDRGSIGRQESRSRWCSYQHPCSPDHQSPAMCRCGDSIRSLRRVPGRPGEGCRVPRSAWCPASGW